MKNKTIYIKNTNTVTRMTKVVKGCNWLFTETPPYSKFPNFIRKLWKGYKEHRFLL